MPQQLTQSLQRELLVQAEHLRQSAGSEPGILPPSVLDKLQRVQVLLRQVTPDTARLAMIGHGLLVWHLDQGFREVRLHEEVAAFGRRLVELQADDDSTGSGP